jgi:hypothetical protein
MTPEVAILDVIPEKTAEFELSFQKAQEILSSIIIIPLPGCGTLFHEI